MINSLPPHRTFNGFTCCMQIHRVPRRDAYRLRRRSHIVWEQVSSLFQGETKVKRWLLLNLIDPITHRIPSWQACKFDLALLDAEKACEMKPGWNKAWWRKAWVPQNALNSCWPPHLAQNCNNCEAIIVKSSLTWLRRRMSVNKQ